MRIATTRTLITLAAAALIVSCVHQRPLPTDELTSFGTITFRNQSRDRIQVYLVGEKEDWLLGRLESLETAHLQLPEQAFVSGRSIELVVIPSWTRTLQPRREPRAALSISERIANLAGEEWAFVNGQVQGPMRPQFQPEF